MRRIHGENIGRMKAANEAAVKGGGSEIYNVATQKYIVILDVYSVHRSKEFITWYKEDSGMGEQGLLLFVPANFTGQLQPLDVSFNGPFKRLLKKAMMKWLANEISAQIADGVLPSAVKTDLTLTALKEPFSVALAQTLKTMAEPKYQTIIKKGFQQAGLNDAFEEETRSVLNTAAVELHRLDKLWSRGKNTRTDGVGAFDMLDVQADMEAIDQAIENAVAASGVEGVVSPASMTDCRSVSALEGAELAELAELAALTNFDD